MAKKDESNNCAKTGACSTYIDECPVTCGECPQKENLNTIGLTHKKCTEKIELAGKVPDACWTMGEGDTKENVYFFGKKGDVYKGFVPSQPGTTVHGFGDVKDGKEPVIFSVRSDEHREALAELNVKHDFPITEDMIKRVDLKKPENSDLMRVMVPKEATERLKKRSSMNLETREDLPQYGFKYKLRPVYTKNFKTYVEENNLGDPAKILTGALVIAIMAFYDETLGVKIEVEVEDPVYYNKKMLASDKGYASTVKTDKNGPNFDYGKYGEDVNGVLFLTHTPVEDVDKDYNALYVVEDSVCRTTAERVAIANFLDLGLATIEVLRQAIALMLGFKPDYFLKGDKVVKRYSKKGTLCTGTGGFMGAKKGATHWTECSNDDIKKAVRDDVLKCLPEVKCGDKKDWINLCPVIVKNVDGACETPFAHKFCHLSCSTPICSSSVIKDAKLPDDYKCEDPKKCEDKAGVLCTADRCKVPQNKGNGKFDQLCEQTCGLCK